MADSRIGTVVFACALVVLVGCYDPDALDSVSTVAVRDSLGIRIVTRGPGPFEDTVALRPSLSIGREGDPDYEFFSIRQLSALASGNIVVANGGTSELLFFGADGRHLRRVGQRGEGPSEFGLLTTVYTRAGDTLAVMDL